VERQRLYTSPSNAGKMTILSMAAGHVRVDVHGFLPSGLA
jgi:hypothetical protein